MDIYTKRYLKTKISKIIIQQRINRAIIKDNLPRMKPYEWEEHFESEKSK